MIYTYSVIKGYKAMNGTALLHLPLLAASLIYIEVPVGLGAAIDQNLRLLYTMQMFIHLLSSVLWFMEINLKMWKRMETWLEVWSILIIISSFFVFMIQFSTLSYLADTSALGPIAERPTEFIKFQFWVQLEVLFAFAIVLSNVLFLIFRFFFKTKFTLVPQNYEMIKL